MTHLAVIGGRMSSAYTVRVCESLFLQHGPVMISAISAVILACLWTLTLWPEFLESSLLGYTSFHADIQSMAARRSWKT